MPLTKNHIWQSLAAHKSKLVNTHIKDLFSQDHTRFDQFSLEAAGIFLDYSKQRIVTETLQLLCQLAENANLADKRDAMFDGAIINTTEQRAVLHTALRDPSSRPIFIDGENIKPLIFSTLQRLEQCVTKVRDGKWHGYSNKPITAIVNIGIGGSDLGPAMATMALTPYAARQLSYHFVSNIDSTHLIEALRTLDPATTLFVVASKTFTTQETLCNATTARKWLLDKVITDGINDEKLAISRHFIAVTAKPERAKDFGINEENIFPFWDWVGGRYSMWSAIGLTLAIAIGTENFRALLAGAHAMDQHFMHAPYAQNMPVILALLGIWNINFWHNITHAVLPYDQYLQLLPSYLQQLDMESNGKHVQLSGAAVNYATAPIIWGAVGTNGQHAFHQLLMQGTETVPVDFIIAAQSHNPCGNHHTLLMANCLAQAQALMRGRSFAEALTEISAQEKSSGKAKMPNNEELQQLAAHKVIPGNVPSNMLMLEQLTPYTLGALLALYEHKVFVQGVIWNINSFDQWGVELGKQLANNIAAQLSEKNISDSSSLDSSTAGLLARFHKFSS